MRRLHRARSAVLALSAASALALTGALPAAAAVTVPSAPVSNYDDGLYGAPDVFSSAYKQALALLAISTLDQSQVTKDDETSVDAGLSWLEQQQCAGGGWQGYHVADVACGPLSTDFNDSLYYVGPDSNTTAIVVQAFEAFGVNDGPVPDALDFLRGLQNSDGGFGFNTGSGSDPNSTALAIQAFIAAGVDPATLAKGSNTPYSYLQSLQLDCTAAAADRGGIQAPFALGSANVLATVQSVPALAGEAYPVYQKGALTPDGPTLECPALTTKLKTGTSTTNAATTTVSPSPTETAAPTASASATASASESASPTPSESAAPADSAAPTESATPTPTESATPTPTATAASKPAPAKVTAPKAKPALAASTPSEAAQIAASWVASQLTPDGYLDGGFGPDYTSTAYAAMGFAATGTQGNALTSILNYFKAHLSAATKSGGKDDPGNLGLTALAAIAGDLDPTDFAGSDLISRIEALQYFTPEAPTTEPTDGGTTVGSGGEGGGVVEGPQPSDLPFTGFESDTLVRNALLVMVLGALLVAASRVRKPMQGRHTA